MHFNPVHQIPSFLVVPDFIDYQETQPNHDVSEWKELPGYSLYRVSPQGQIWNVKRKRLLSVCQYGEYNISALYNDERKRTTLSNHRLVATLYVPNPNNLPSVNHIDGSPLNNDYRNLEWTNATYNANHSIKMGLSSCIGENHHNTILKNDDVRQIYKSLLPKNSLAEYFNISVDTIRKIQNGKIWVAVTKGLTRDKYITIPYKGTWLSISEVAKLTDHSPALIRRRIHEGYGLEKSSHPFKNN
jgi:hypothetical protein